MSANHFLHRLETTKQILLTMREVYKIFVTERSWERGDREESTSGGKACKLILLPEQPPVGRHSVTSSWQNLFLPNHPMKNPLLQNSHRKAQHGQSNSRKTRVHSIKAKRQQGQLWARLSNFTRTQAKLSRLQAGKTSQKKTNTRYGGARIV